MAETRILQAVAIGIDEIECIGADVLLGTEDGVGHSGRAAVVDGVVIEVDALADRCRSRGEDFAGEVKDGAQPALQVRQVHARFYMIEVDVLGTLSRLFVACSRATHDACGLRIASWLGEVWEEERTALRAEQGHVSEQLFERAMCTRGIVALKIVLGVQHEGWLTPDQLALELYLQRLDALDGIVGTRRGTMFPIGNIGRRGVQLPVIEEAKAALLPDERTLQRVRNDLDILGLDGLFAREQVDELQRDP